MNTQTNSKRSTMSYHERLLELINRRSLALHKASSVRRILPEDEREHKKAYHEGVAEYVKSDLVDLVVSQFPDKRPVPAKSYEYEGKTYVLQRYDGVTSWYVPQEKWNADLYEYDPIPYRDHIEAEINCR